MGTVCAFRLVDLGPGRGYGIEDLQVVGRIDVSGDTFLSSLGGEKVACEFFEKREVFHGHDAEGNGEGFSTQEAAVGAA